MATVMPTIIRRWSPKVEAARQARRAANLAYDKMFADAALAERLAAAGAVITPVEAIQSQAQQPSHPQPPKQQQHNGKR